jgi:cytochrome c peroxidase
VALLLSTSPAAPQTGDAVSPAWTAAERERLRSLSLLPVPPAPPPSPSNAWADDPRAAALGRELFFDVRLSVNGDVACATCHQPQHAFADTLPRSLGVGETRRNAPTVLGAAFQRWLYWDGRRDSLWAQALTPIEHPHEQGLARVAAVGVVAGDPALARLYEAVFDERLPAVLDDSQRFPPDATPAGDEAARLAWQGMDAADRTAIDRAFARIGKAIAAYERTLLPAPSRFDHFVAAVLAGDEAAAAATLDARERAGLRLFIGERAQCTRCHNGPMLSNGGFHNIGLTRSDVPDPDLGRARAVAEVQHDPFNCLGPQSDAPATSCIELRFMKTRGAELLGAFRVPSLRNVARTAPYMHDGRFATLEAVLAHYMAAPAQGIVGHQ